MFRKNLAKNQKGFTLIELMISLVILATVFYALFEFVIIQQNIMTDETMKAQLNEQAKTTLGKIVDEMRSSKGSVATKTGITLYPDKTTDSEITLAEADPANPVNPVKLVVINYEYQAGSYKEVCYKLQDGALKRFDLGTSMGDLALASDVYDQISNAGFRQKVDAFRVTLTSNDPSNNFCKYLISLTLSGGPDTKKVTVNQEATVIKNKTPN